MCSSHCAAQIVVSCFGKMKCCRCADNQVLMSHTVIQQCETFPSHWTHHRTQLEERCNAFGRRRSLCLHAQLMPRSDDEIFLSVKMFTVSGYVIIESKILPVLWLRDMTDYMFLPDQSAFAVFHDMGDVTGKEALATDFSGKECKQTWRLKRWYDTCCLVLIKA